MTIFKRVLTAVAGTAMLVAPIAASAAPAPVANPAAKLSIARAGAPTTGNSKLGAAVPGTTLISIGILAALVVGVLVATGGDDDSDSN
jgi:hypothetical protein